MMGFIPEKIQLRISEWKGREIMTLGSAMILISSVKRDGIHVSLFFNATKQAVEIKEFGNERKEKKRDINSLSSRPLEKRK